MAKKAYIGVGGVARQVKKGYIGVGGVPVRSLPSGYTQVEYIQSSGTQYIDTRFAPASDNMRIVLDFEYTASHSAQSLFGDQLGANQQSMLVAYGDPAFYVGTSMGILPQSTSLNLRYMLSCQANNGTLTVNLSGVVSQSSYTGTLYKSGSLYLLANNVGGEPEQNVSAKLYSCQIYDNGAIVRDYVPCVNSSNTAGLYDLVNGVFYTNAGTGSFTVGNVVTEDTSVARKIKKAYIGIGGVARPFWSGGEVEYYGTITDLSVGRYHLAATTVGNYALFGGGHHGSNSNKVDTYTSSLVKGTATDLSVGRYSLAATTVGNYALFGGGYHGSNIYSSVVDVYQIS